MLRLILAAALVLCGITLALCPVHAAPTINVDGGVARTAKAVRAAVTKRDLDGHVWLGKLRGVGGGRDTLVFVPRTLDPTRTIDVVIYFEGIGSFDDAAMDHRHAASIARLRGNTVYVAPDAPSSTHGIRAAKTPYWVAGCADRRCAGGHAAPGDFLVFLDEVRGHIARTTGQDRATLALQHSLIGFSRGGKGVGNALDQLVAADFTAGGVPVRLADVIFADGNYGEYVLAETWRVLAARREAPRLTILVARGEFTRVGGDGNRRRALAFWRAAAPKAALPTADRPVSVERFRIVPLRGGHHAIGDAAVDFLPPPEVLVWTMS
ncbi:MAG: hypothetical protein M4D80_14850 [Myxococcota bacterium]|nr:hypothetical protein [Myxococcota bacterium]